MKNTHRSHTLKIAIRLVDLLNEHGWVSSSQVAEKLRIAPRTARRWMQAAEEVMALEVRYRESRPEGQGSISYYRLRREAR